MFEITEACLAASMIDSRAPKSNNSHCNETAEMVPRAELLLLVLAPTPTGPAVTVAELLPSLVR
jgi:hypothetical protein